MVVERDIVAISIPFTAGVAAAAVLPPGGGDFIFRAALASSAVLALMFALLTRKGTQTAAICTLFFFLGASCMLNAICLGKTAVHTPPPFLARALRSFTALIDSIQFSDSRTGPLVKALLTGQKDSIPVEITNAFRQSGAAHILALSGLHLGVIYAVLTRMLSLIGNSRTAAVLRSGAAIAAAGAYTVMTGAGPSIVRAFLFITLNETLRLLPGRRREPLSILCAALTMQLAFNPMVIKSVGFQLSYLSMLGIFLFFPVLDSWYPPSGRMDLVRRIWSSAALSISCQLLTAPLAWKYFHSFPKYFLLTNIIALPLAEGLMVCSAACISLAGMGWCPDIMKSPVDLLARTLIFCLETISGM